MDHRMHPRPDLWDPMDAHHAGLCESQGCNSPRTYLVRRPVLIHAKGAGCSELGSVTSMSCCLGRSRALSFFTR